MIMQSLNLFQDVDSDEKKKKTLTQINTAAIVPKHVLEIDLEYPKKSLSCIMIILLLQIK